jgi:hypothetical protein
MSHCSSGSRTQSSSLLVLFDQLVRGRGFPIVFRIAIGFIVALTGAQTICAQACSTPVSLQGAPPVGTFSTALNVTCGGGESFGINWGDNSTFSGQSDQSGVIADSHAYPSSGPWYISVTAGSGAAQQYLSFPNSPVPSGVFSGTTTTVVAAIAATAFGAGPGSPTMPATSIPITVGCAPNVVAPDGTIVPLQTLNISCLLLTSAGQSASGTVTASTTCHPDDSRNQLCVPDNGVGSPETLTFDITTSGLAGTPPFARLRPQHVPRSPLPVAAWVFGIIPVAFLRRSWRKRFTSALMPSLIVMLGLSLTSCGGGFTPPPGASAQTPSGTYLVTVLISSNMSGFVQTSLIVPITVVPTQ